MFLPSNITLSPGDSGEFVQELQRRLSSLGLYPADETHGQYDGTTTRSVSGFQSQQGLRSDGVAGPETLRRLNGVISGTYTESKEAQLSDATATLQTLHAYDVAAQEIAQEQPAPNAPAEFSMVQHVPETAPASAHMATTEKPVAQESAVANQNADRHYQDSATVAMQTQAYAALHHASNAAPIPSSETAKVQELTDNFVAQPKQEMATQPHAQPSSLPQQSHETKPQHAPETKPALEHASRPPQADMPLQATFIEAQQSQPPRPELATATSAPTNKEIPPQPQRADITNLKDQVITENTRASQQIPQPVPVSDRENSTQKPSASAPPEADQNAQESKAQSPSLRQRLSGLVARIADYMESKLSPSVIAEVQKIGMQMAQHGVRETPLPQNDNSLPSPSATPTRGAAPAPERIG